MAKLVDEMAEKWGVGGMDATTIYGQFAIEVAKEAIAYVTLYADHPRDVD